MDDCCEVSARELAGQRAFAHVLWAVLAINAALFGVELIGALLAGSTALAADALDMLEDAAIYALSLYALHRSARWRAGAALVKSAAMGAAGLATLGLVVAKVLAGTAPAAPLMTGFALAGLAGNLACALLLLRFRAGEVNMRSTWLCTRNDVLANLSVLLAAALVALTGSLWPDVLIALAIAALVLHSAHTVLRDAWAQLAPRPSEA